MCSAFRAIRRFNGVVIAAVNGYALGAGLECALSCDYIVAEKGAKLGMPQARLGQIPFAGGAKLLFDRVGEAWTKRMVLGGELLDAEQAIRIGLIEELVDPGFAKIIAVSLANKVARQGPVAVRESRRLIQACGSVSLEDHLPAARKALLALVDAEEQKAGAQAFLDQHNPPWCTDEDDED
jgi:enoyl-CoA hydratase/carnithine racemase